jgi:hypothetical protein
MRKPTAFNRLAQLGEALEATRSRLQARAAQSLDSR